MRNFLLVISAFSLSAVLHAQVIPEDPQSAIQSLKKGVLIVRLDMKENVIKAYADLVERSTGKEKERAEEKYASLKNSREEYRNNVIQAMRNSFEFCRVCFISNDDMKVYLAGDNSVINCPEDQPLKGNPLFFLVKGQRDSHWIITDQEFNPLPHPFPASHDLGIKKLFDFIIGKDNYSLQNLEKVFSKMDERLDVFYAKSSQ